MSNRTGITAALVVIMLSASATARAQAIEAGKNEVETDFSLTSSKWSGIDSNRTTEFNWRITYGRFVSDRIAIGPVFGIRNDVNTGSKPFNAGGLVRFYFGDGRGAAIPFVEATSTRAFNQAFEMDYTDLQISGGLVFPMGESGGRFRVAPYYYRAFFDPDLHGFSHFHSFGVSWSVGLLF
ncbi:MAG TPA: hypothetical protein VFZ31_14305 [Vicinamibacterales bacterium]